MFPLVLVAKIPSGMIVIWHICPAVIHAVGAVMVWIVVVPDTWNACDVGAMVVADDTTVCDSIFVIANCSIWFLSRIRVRAAPAYPPGLKSMVFVFPDTAPLVPKRTSPLAVVLLGPKAILLFSVGSRMKLGPKPWNEPLMLSSESE